MSPLFAKLNFKGQARMLAIDAPASFEPELAALNDAVVDRAPNSGESYGFAIGFAVVRADLDRVSAQLIAAAPGDAVVWLAYPKKSSKRYRCDFDRDSGWTVLGDAAFEPVRQVAIDEDWSALRFRRVEYIKHLNRDAARTLSAQGHARTKGA
ncbi:MAG: hypothetical protein KA144_12145 [Xanthomonadaceae bacterium]|nr:hypothetical protein [Xanthomonadaceae bacterium]